MEFGLLGPLEARSAGVPVVLRGAVRRRLLAIFLLHPNRAMPAGRLEELLWDVPPATASNVLQVHVAALRRILAQAEPKVREARIATAGGGYLLRLEPSESDAATFEEAVAEARRIARDQPHQALVTLDRALGLWRGEMLADIDLPSDLVGSIARVEALRDFARDLSFELRILMGEAAAVIPDLEVVVERERTNEHRLALLMRALYQAGRQADALAAYQTGRRRLIEELGLDPGPALQALQAAILRQDASLDAGVEPGPAALSAPPSVADRERHHLPAEPNSFIGRDEDIAAITALFGSGARLVTITGLGGSGKSRLAAQLGRRLEGEFRDGVRWVDLAPTASGDQVPDAIAVATGVREQPGRTVFDSLIGALRAQHQLLIVDNCEPFLWHAARALEAILEACPQVVVLATSREPLRLAIETAWPLLGLGRPDRPSEAELAHAQELRGNEAVALFLDRGRAANPRRHVTDEDLPAVAAIVRRVDGLPLAIEMAAAWLRAMGPHEIAGRLAGGSSLLALASGAPRARHRTLEATFDSSFDLLEPEEQRLLPRLSVFAGSVDAEAIEAVGGWDLADPIGSVATLVDRSLVVAVASTGATHYRLLETIREYARLKLRAAGKEHEVADRHLQWCLAVAEQAYWRRVRDEPGAIQVLTEQLDELRLALDRSAGHGDGAMPRLAGLLAWFWAATGRVTEGRRRVASALDEAQLDIDRGRLLVGLGATATFLGDPTSAVASLEEAVRVWHEHGDAFEECLALSALGWAHFWPGENEQALASFRSGAAMAEAIGAHDLRLRLLAGECQVLVAAGDPDRALPLARYLADTARPGDVRTAHLAHHFLADCSLLVADCRAAAREYGVALGLARQLDDQLEIMIELQGVAMAQAGLGRPREAVLLAGAADEGLDRLGLVTTVPFWVALLERWIGGAMASLPAPERVRSEGKALGLIGALELASSLPS